MSPVDGVWHLANLLAPAFGIGTVAALLAKILWFGTLRNVSWFRLAGAATAASALVLLIGLAVSGRDGKMATYSAATGACALALWWIGFARTGR